MYKPNKVLIICMLAVTAVVFGTTNGYAHAQQATQALSDAQVEIIVISTIVGGLGAPIIGYATSEVSVAKGSREPFDFGQYALAVPLVLVGSLGLMLTELTTVTVTGTGIQADLILFIMVFTQALGIDYLKSRTGQAITNSQITVAVPVSNTTNPPSVTPTPAGNTTGAPANQSANPSGQALSVTVSDPLAVTEEQ